MTETIYSIEYPDGSIRNTTDTDTAAYHAQYESRRVTAEVSDDE